METSESFNKGNRSKNLHLTKLKEQQYGRLSGGGEIEAGRPTSQEVAAKHEEMVYFTTILPPAQKWQEKSDKTGLI